MFFFHPHIIDKITRSLTAGRDICKYGIEAVYSERRQTVCTAISKYLVPVVCDKEAWQP